MKRILDHYISASLKEYISHRLLVDGEAFTNRTCPLYEYLPQDKSSLIAYGAAYAGWVYNSSVSGVQIPTTAGGFSRGQNGLKFDFKNGRVLFNSSNAGLNLSLNVSIPNFNLYITSKSDYSLINDTLSGQTPEVVPATTYVKPNSILTSALFIKNYSTKNKEFAFSGYDSTKFNMRLVGICRSEFELILLQGILRDLKERYFPLLTTTPLDEFNDLKSGTSYNYQAIMDAQNSLVRIDDVTFQTFENDTFAKNNPNIFMGIGHLTAALERFPRI